MLRSYDIIPAHDPALIPHVRHLFIEYAESLGFDLCFQGFEKELAGLPGKYAPPEGTLVLAVSTKCATATDVTDDLLAGCVALRPIDRDVCEMKRLYVRPDHRGSGLGRRLAVEIVANAQKIGYRAMRLDTLDHMTAAIALYESLGFKRIAPYYANPIATTVYLELIL